MRRSYLEDEGFSVQIAETLHHDALPDLEQINRWHQAIMAGVQRYAPSAYNASNGINLRIVDQAEALALNKRYRNQDHATNVLAFPWAVEPALAGLEDVTDTLPLGDIAICWPKVLEEASTLNLSKHRHFLHLFIHGILHLLGYDHQKAAEAKVMWALEDKILASLCQG